METREVDIAEQKLNFFARFAIYHQAFWLFLLTILLITKPHHYKIIGEGLGMIALLASFMGSRIYIYYGKKVEQFKKFSSEELQERLKEHKYRFFLPYFLWAGTVAFFSSV